MPSRCRLYLISPPEPGPDFAAALSAALDAGDVACFQLRLKDVDDEVVRRAVRELMPLCQSRDVAFILNDRPDLAARLGCDGVHVGQEDTPYEDARRIMAADAIVGVTCHDSLDLAYRAAEAGADYVAFGAFFESGTKKRRFAPELELLEHWQSTTTVPCVAIGGITAENCRSLVKAGADFLAVSAGVFAHPQGPAAAVRAFNDIFDQEAPDQDDPPLED